jgi:hypothetical protein
LKTSTACMDLFSGYFSKMGLRVIHQPSPSNGLRSKIATWWCKCRIMSRCLEGCHPLYFTCLRSISKRAVPLKNSQKISTSTWSLSRAGTHPR